MTRADRLVRTPEGWRIARREMKVHREVGSRAVLGSRSERTERDPARATAKGLVA